VVDPNTPDFAPTKQLKNRIDGADVSFDVELGYPAASFRVAANSSRRARVGVWPTSA
jgi:hypothetical protein